MHPRIQSPIPPNPLPSFPASSLKRAKKKREKAPSPCPKTTLPSAIRAKSRKSMFLKEYSLLKIPYSTPNLMKYRTQRGELRENRESSLLFFLVSGRGRKNEPGFSAGFLPSSKFRISPRVKNPMPVSPSFPFLDTLSCVCLVRLVAVGLEGLVRVRVHLGGLLRLRQLPLRDLLALVVRRGLGLPSLLKPGGYALVEQSRRAHGKQRYFHSRRVSSSGLTC